MDETPTEQIQSEPNSSSDTPSFRTVRHREGKGKKTLVIVLVVLGVLLIGGGLFFFIGNRARQSEPTPTPSSQLEVMETVEPEPTSTSEPANREEISIDVQNGTGIAKEASYLQGILKEMGYSQVSLGNADNQSYEDAVVTFSSGLPSSVVSEITDKLESVYGGVETKTGSSSKDIVIITGLRKGVTPVPKSTSTPTPAVSATKTPVSSPTPTPSPTVSPSPTPSP